MKKTILLLLLGLVCSIGNVWGTDLCSATLNGIDATANTTGVSQTGCTMKWNGVSTSSGDIVTISSSTYHKFSGSSSYVQLILNSGSFQAGDVLTVTACSNAGSGKTKDIQFSLNSDSGNKSTVKAAAGNAVTNIEYTLVAADIESDGSIKIFRAGNSNIRFGSFSVTGSRALAITTHPVSAEYLSGAAATALTVAASGGTAPYTYQWYSCSDANKTNPQEVGTNSASYTPSTSASGYYFCQITDAAATPAVVSSNVATITISAASAPTINIESTADAAVDKGTTVTLTATVTGVPAPSIQWYSNTSNVATVDNEHKISGATNETYSPSTASMGTTYYYAVATNYYNDEYHTATSNIMSVEVNGSNACELKNIKFSNGAYGAIGTLSDGAATINVPYLIGEAAPSINESSIVISADATKVIDGNTITVTAEDGATTGTYTITKTAFTPLEVSGDISTTTFTAVPSWIYNPYDWTSDKGIKFAKKVDEASNMRIAKGMTRQYYFIGAAQSLTLTAKGTVRKVNVYVNGTNVISDTNNDALGAITLNPNAPCMVMVESNQTGGDGGFSAYAITGSTTIGGTISATGWNTFSSSYKLDLSSLSAEHDVAAYVATAANENVTLTSTDAKVPANTGLMIKGTAGDAFTINVTSETTTTPAKNYLVAGTGAAVAHNANGNAYNYVLVKNGDDAEFQRIVDTKPATVPIGKAYLSLPSLPASAPNRLLIVEEEENATSIEAVEATDKAAKFFKNGNLYILRDGVVYDVTGRIVR